MNEKLLDKAIECYITKLENENELLKKFRSEIIDCLAYHGINESDTDRINAIMCVKRYYDNAFEKEVK